MLFKMKYRSRGVVMEALMDVDTKELQPAYDYCEAWCKARPTWITQFVSVDYAVLNQKPEPKVEAATPANKVSGTSKVA